MEAQALLNKARIFHWFNRLVGTDRRCRILVKDYIRPAPGTRILDTGCGLAELLDYLPEGVEYVGLDIHKPYVEASQRRHKGRGSFYCQDIAQMTTSKNTRWDRILAIGVLHHVNDADALALFQQAKAALADGGFFLSVDGCFTDGQSELMKSFLKLDRGHFVRHESEYRRLASKIFPSVKATVREDLIRIPHTELLMECQ